MEVLKKLATGEEKIDMTRMSNLIHRKVLDSLSAVSCKLLLIILLPNQILSLTPKTKKKLSMWSTVAEMVEL